METPKPLASDPDDLATALETAAIFAAKNDSAEAAHWVKRAAECAKEHGDEARAAALARSAAELSREPDRRLPTTPPRRPSMSPPPPSVRPPPPSERGRREPSSDSQPMLLVRPSSTPAATAPRASTPPRPATALAAKVEVAPNLRDVPEESTVRRSSPSTAPPPKPAEVSKSSPKPTARPATHRFLRLQGARVSVVPSEASERFYLVKVLDDDDPVPAGEQEAFLVLAHPTPR